MVLPGDEMSINEKAPRLGGAFSLMLSGGVSTGEV
jgi:hypothetical protein